MKSKIYFGLNINSVSQDIRWAEMVVDITEKDREKIFAALKEAKINKWSYSYTDDNESNDENFWDMGIEFENSKIVSFSGKGDVPDSYPKFREVIFEMSKE